VLGLLGMLDLRGVLSVLGLLSECIHLPGSTDKCVLSIESASGVSYLLRVCWVCRGCRVCWVSPECWVCWVCRVCSMF